MILIYTGDGKGKTSACAGQALRAHGQGLRVFFAQFMKRPDQAGEQRALTALLGENFFAGGKGFFRQEGQRPSHRQAALEVLGWARQAVGRADLLVLDEALYALGAGLLLEEEVRDIVTLARTKGAHLVLSGRGLPDWLRAEADIVTEMLALKHDYEDGRQAVKGIEY